MQLTLVQTEIEQALREYVGRQLTVANGTKMTIDLQATRGAEGFKATIDILPADSPEVVAPAKPTFRPEVSQSKVPFTVPSTARTPEPGVVEDPALENPQTAVVSAVEAPAEVGSQLDQLPSSDNAQPAQDQATAGSEPATPSTRGSLFKGLGKPKNN